MKKIALVALVSMTALAQEVPDAPYQEMWLAACGYNDCTDVPTPRVEWIWNAAAIRGPETPTAGYNSDTGTVYLLIGSDMDDMPRILIHEYTHHINHHNGKAVVDVTDKFSICRSEKYAYQVSRSWALKNGRGFIRNWRRYYPMCQQGRIFVERL